MCDQTQVQALNLCPLHDSLDRLRLYLCLSDKMLKDDIADSVRFWGLRDLRFQKKLFIWLVTTKTSVKQFFPYRTNPLTLIFWENNNAD